jgi:Sulfotransferase family
MIQETEAGGSTPRGITPRVDVLFVHIQKTAGMSLYNSMAQWFGGPHSLRYRRSSEEFRQQFLRLTEEEIARFRLLSGHFELPFWLQRKLGDRFVISLVREPVERVLSAYRYAKSWKGHRMHEVVRRMSMAEYVDEYVGDASRHNWQCRQLCGTDDFGAARTMALQQIDLLGAVELMGLFTRTLSDDLGVPLDTRTDNASPDQRPRREDLDAALVSKLQACNVEDYKLWTYVIEMNLVRGHGHRA